MTTTKEKIALMMWCKDAGAAAIFYEAGLQMEQLKILHLPVMAFITKDHSTGLYQVKGEKHYYRFDYEYLDQVQKDFAHLREPMPADFDNWYNELGGYRRKKVKAVKR